MLFDEVPNRADVEPHQLRWSLHADVCARLSHWAEAEHRFIKAAVSRVHLDEEIRAIVMHRSVDKDGVKQRGKPRPCGARCIESEFCKLA